MGLHVLNSTLTYVLILKFYVSYKCTLMVRDGEHFTVLSLGLDITFNDGLVYFHIKCTLKSSDKIIGCKFH